MMSSVPVGNANAPAWLREEGLEDIHPLNPVPGQAGFPGPIAVPSADSDKRYKLIHYLLKAVTMFLCMLMSATAVIGLGYLNGVDAVEKVFVISYMFFFSALLFIFEAIELRQIEWLDHLFRRNFGFLFSALGKAFFIIFIACLSFGLGDPQTLTYATGSCWALFGLLQVGLYLKYPEMFE